MGVHPNALKNKKKPAISNLICSNLNQLERANTGGFSILGFTKIAS